MKRYIFLFSFHLLFSLMGYTQVTIGSDKCPVKAAILDLKTDVNATAIAANESSNKGLVLPRVHLTNLNALTPFIPSATPTQEKQHTGLMVYNLNETLPFLLGVYIWNGAKWEYSQQQILPPVFEASNGISKTGTTLKLGGTLKEKTEINLAGNALMFRKATGTFSVNTNDFVVSNTNTGIGAVPTTSKLTVGGATQISDDLNVAASTSSLKKTDITGLLYYKDPAVPNPKGYVLKSTNSAGVATWVPTSTIPGINTSYIEGTFGSGLNLPIADFNKNTRYHIKSAKITLNSGLWIIYISLVVQPKVVSVNAEDPIWGRFTLSTSASTYNEIRPNTSDGVYRIGALNISDRLYPNVTKNVVKGYMIVRVKKTSQDLYLWLGNTATNSGYSTWPATVSNVKIGDSTDPQNYMVAFPL